MTLRAAKTALVFAVALFYSLVVFSNITDYNSNYQLIRHVLMMDSTFPDNHGMWRAINSPAVHTVFYIIDHHLGVDHHGSLLVGRRFAWRAPARQQRPPHSIKPSAWRSSRLTISLLMWLVAFLSVGAEWFLMWQSKTWNGQEAAFRMFTVSRRRPNLPSPTRRRRATLTQYHRLLPTIADSSSGIL